MILSWMLYSVAVAALLGGAAGAAEALLRWLGRPTRLAWAAALVASAMLPVWAILPDTGATSTAPVGPAPSVGIEIGTVRVVAADPPLLSASVAWMDVPLLWIWGSGTVLLLLWIGGAVARLHAARRTWKPARVGGMGVLLSRVAGPAVMGWWRGAIVVPEWALSLGRRKLRLLLAHEAEHLRAADPTLLRAGLVLVVLFSWNPILWWQLSRLRFAVEADCDARVLRRRRDVRTYGALLLDVGNRRARSGAVGVALAEPHSALERRIRMMTKPIPKFRAARVVAAALTVGGMLALVRCVPEPVTPEVRSLEEATAESRLGKEPTFTPYEVQPELLDRVAFVEALSGTYPPLLREAGIGGTVDLWVFVSSTGRVVNARVDKSSGRPELDAAALEVVRGSRWKPARNRGDVVPAWVQIPVVFRTGEETAMKTPAPAATETEREVRRANERAEMIDAEANVTFTPYQVQPGLLDRNMLAQLLKSHYPSVLRDSGIGGTATLWFYIDERGTVAKTVVGESSGFPELDAAARRAASELRFTPALNNDQPVAVWVQLPITFSAKSK